MAAATRPGAEKKRQVRQYPFALPLGNRPVRPVTRPNDWNEEPRKETRAENKMAAGGAEKQKETNWNCQLVFVGTAPVVFDWLPAH